MAMENGLGGIFGFVYGAASQLLSKIVLAALVVLAGFVFGKLLGKIVFRTLQEVELNSLVRTIFGLRLSIDELLGNAVTFLAYFASIVAALFILGIATLAFNAVAILIAILLVISALFSLKDYVPNVLAGITIHSRKSVRPGDILEVSGIRGRVMHVGSVDVKIATKQGEIIYVPNSLFLRELSKVARRG